MIFQVFAARILSVVLYVFLEVGLVTWHTLNVEAPCIAQMSVSWYKTLRFQKNKIIVPTKSGSWKIALSTTLFWIKFGL